ncbi:MAG: MgtC/SapB family protein [Clostridia bacterium]|nr:MgtC/SapB family protein [Clostridia bacterium]
MRLDIVIFRLLLAVLAGLVIGVERARHGRAAGMRTHILVCLGSAITAMTGLYASSIYHSGDIFRLSAQVISGVGFLGAGMIVLKNDNVIMGLTTAAGVWATSALGIAIGYGFYAGAATVTVLLLITLILFSKFERRKKNTMVVYLEIEDMHALNRILDEIHNLKLKDCVTRVTTPKSSCVGHIGLEVVFDRRARCDLGNFLEIAGIVFAIEA